MMRKIALILVAGIINFTLVFGVLAPPLAHAAINNPLDKVCADNADSTVCQENGKTQDVTNNSIYGHDGIITKTARLLSIIIGITAVVMIMFAGFKFITSQGDANQVASARNTAIYAVVGLVVVALAQAIIIFVLDRIK